jgi:hypothetical protein
MSAANGVTALSAAARFGPPLRSRRTTVVCDLTGVIAVRRRSPRIAAVDSCVEAVVGTVVAWFLLGEHPGDLAPTTRTS